MEFHGTWSAPISLTREVPWNSMELGVRQFCWHKKFHGIPWNLECANFADRSSSMEFYGTCGAPISLTWAVPWNSVELRMRQFRWHEKFHGIPWNYECANFDDKSCSMEFHGIPWNLECANFTDTSSSMEFHGTWSAPISLTREVPWNSMNLECANFADRSSSTEFPGIPWNLEYANFNDTSSSMEFHGSMSAPISMTWAVPWNSMELGVRQFRWQEQFHGIPWNSMELWVRQFRWLEQFHGIPWN